MCRLLICFNTQPPEGGWFQVASTLRVSTMFQHTAARRRLDYPNATLAILETVSTHSRPKAAGSGVSFLYQDTLCFNTQPPEGGWIFQTKVPSNFQNVSTHSRPKAAGEANAARLATDKMFQHTAARRRLGETNRSRPKLRRFNTQPPEGGWLPQDDFLICLLLFQHTAARRRLVYPDEHYP